MQLYSSADHGWLVDGAPLATSEGLPGEVLTAKG